MSSKAAGLKSYMQIRSFQRCIALRIIIHRHPTYLSEIVESNETTKQNFYPDLGKACKKYILSEICCADVPSDSLDAHDLASMSMMYVRWQDVLHYSNSSWKFKLRLPIIDGVPIGV